MHRCRQRPPRQHPWLQPPRPWPPRRPHRRLWLRQHRLQRKACPGCRVSPCRSMPLQQIATASGLQWVNSDAEKIAAAQAAIAAEPKPVHVPRERPPAVIPGRRPAGAGGNPSRPLCHDAAPSRHSPRLDGPACACRFQAHPPKKRRPWPPFFLPLTSPPAAPPWRGERPSPPPTASTGCITCPRTLRGRRRPPSVPSTAADRIGSCMCPPAGGPHRRACRSTPCHFFVAPTWPTAPNALPCRHGRPRFPPHATGKARHGARSWRCRAPAPYLPFQEGSRSGLQALS